MFGDGGWGWSRFWPRACGGTWAPIARDGFIMTIRRLVVARVAFIVVFIVGRVIDVATFDFAVRISTPDISRVD